MTYTPYPYGHALDDDLDDDLDSTTDSVDDSNTPVLLNGMKILFDKAVPVSPVNLLPKAQLSRRKPYP